MPLVIYLGLHAIMREPASILPPEQRQATLAVLNVNAPTATLDEEEHSPAEEAKDQLAPVLLLDTLTEEAVGTISQWLRQDTANHIALIWLQPVPYIAARLAQEADAESALQEWQHMANATLSFFRQHRRQVTLVGAELGVESPAQNDITLLTLPAVEHAPLYTLAATQLLANNTALQEIASHLLASSACVYPQTRSERSNVLTALACHRQTLQHLHTNEQQLNNLKERCSKAENQLAQLHAEKQASEVQFNKQHQAHQAAASKKQAELQQQLNSTQEENEQVITELHKVQETLETTLLERDAARKQAAELKKAQTALEQVQKEKAALETRLSTATTAHQQAKKAAEDAKQQAQKSSQQQQAEHNKALVSVQEENDLIIAELHKVQETLETTLHERDAARKQAAELKKAQTALAQVQKEKAALQTQLTAEQATVQKVQQQHQEAQQQVSRLQQELTSTKEENELVIAELHRLQELLESKLIERDALVKQRDNIRVQHGIVIQQRDSALQQLDQRLAQLQQLHPELKKYQEEQTSLYGRLERYQKQLNIQKSEFQQVLQEQEIWLQWLRAHATRYITATYRYSRAYRKALSQQIALLEVSQHFDKQWYIEQNPDIANSNMSPAEHYIKVGALEGRNPSPNFDTDFYITQNHDVAEAGHHPLLHFLRHGQLEQRLTTYEQRQLPSPSSAVSGVSHE
ncbi:hypothetical protein CUU95_12550 [Vreelandella alkaliphila]|uniref:hypothetical protein n=1 Tax=Vreelandella alkaliphila TaxID=272774 RepID=UPI000EA2A850|nr:hypothetical protein [Halomonas alkaliphila]AYF34583.1 hypothetical protein CUU95_12550 [Halomonas alkaliphila]